MKPLGRPRHHYWLVQRMARATGADLVRAWEAGELCPRDWAAMVGRCRGCPRAHRCERFLARSEAGAPPEFCLNSGMLSTLRQVSKGGG